MTKKMTEEIKEKTEIHTLTLSNGMKVEIDFSKANGYTLLKAREAARNSKLLSATLIFEAAIISTFDGKKLPAEEILNMRDIDILALEAAWDKIRGE